VRKAHKADEAVPDTDVAATVARARDEQLAREIERNEQRLGHNERGLDGDGFVDDRPLHAYEKELVGFYDALRHLEPEDSWIDMGAGRALPMRTIMKRWNAPHMTALAREWPGAPDDLARLVTEGEGRFTPLYGKMLEDYPVASLGRHELVTDFYGPFSYSTHVDDVVRTYAEITNEGGHVQLLFMDTGIDLGAPQGALDWLRECRGLEVVDSRAKGPYQSVDLVRTRDPIDIPPLELRDFRATTPSYRAYDRVAP